MGARDIKVCKCCRKSFRPQLSDEDIRELWFTEEQMEQDREHAEATGHSHLVAPYQDLCEKCANDPDVEALYGGLFGGPVRYRKRPKQSKMKRLKVKDGATRHKMLASDGTEVVLTGSPDAPPQEIVDMMANLQKEFTENGPDGLLKAMGPEAKKAGAVISEKKPYLLERLFGKKKKK